MDIVIYVLLIIVVFMTLCFFIFNAKKESFVEGDEPEENNKYLKVREKELKIPKSKNKNKNKNKQNDDEIVKGNSKVVNDSIIIHDTVRRDSKIDSSLDFTYLDEQQCDRIQLKNKFPVQSVEVNEQAPITPLVDNNCVKNVEKMKIKCESRDKEYLKKKHIRDLERMTEMYGSEMFDDSALKPKPEVESPYGFVYFPNKYWKQWHQKAPVCIPAGNQCKVLPTYTQGAPVDVLDYTQVGSMMPKFTYSEEYEEPPEFQYDN